MNRGIGRYLLITACELPPHRQAIFQFTAYCVVCAHRTPTRLLRLFSEYQNTERIRGIDAGATECVWEAERMEMRVLELVYLQVEAFRTEFCVHKEAEKECDLLKSELACHHLIGHGMGSPRVCALSATTQRDLIRWKVNCKFSHERNYVPLSSGDNNGTTHHIKKDTLQHIVCEIKTTL